MFLYTFLFIFTLFINTIQAEEISGPCAYGGSRKDCQWTFNTETKLFVVSGTNGMPYYKTNDNDDNIGRPFWKYKDEIEKVDADSIMKRQEAIILSMTKEERRHPDIIKASRKRRIARGSGVEVHEVNKLLKSYEQMSTMMKQMGKLGSMKGLASHFMKKNPLMGNNPFGGFNNKFPF